MFVISSHALAREVLVDPGAGLCVSAHRVARRAAPPDRVTSLHLDGSMLVRALLQEAGVPFIISSARCQQFPLTLGNGDWYGDEDLRIRLASRLLAAPNRRLVLPENGDVHGHYFRPSYIETI